jgi:hypothetical protein
VRRRILRYMHEIGEPVGTPRVADAFEERTPQIKYHLLTLAKFRVIEEAGAGGEGISQLYESAVSDDARVLAELERTQEEDEGRHRKAA